VPDDVFADIYEAVVHRQDQFFDFSPLLRLIDLLDKTLARRGLGAFSVWRMGSQERFMEPSKFVAFCISHANFAHYGSP
jgi:hypothetical protein